MSYHLEFKEVKVVTDKAICFVDEEDEEVWVPISQIEDDVDGWTPDKATGSVMISDWIAKQKGYI